MPEIRWVKIKAGEYRAVVDGVPSSMIVRRRHGTSPGYYGAWAANDWWTSSKKEAVIYAEKKIRERAEKAGVS
jgi:hypothetical protein